MASEQQAQNNARAAVAYVNLTLVSAGARLWPEEEQTLKAAVAILDRLSN